MSSKFPSQQTPMVLMQNIVEGDLHVLITSHSLLVCVSRSHSGTYPMPRLTNSGPCELCFLRVTAQGNTVNEYCDRYSMRYRIDSGSSFIESPLSIAPSLLSEIIVSLLHNFGGLVAKIVFTLSLIEFRRVGDLNSMRFDMKCIILLAISSNMYSRYKHFSLSSSLMNVTWRSFFSCVLFVVSVRRRDSEQAA